MARTKRSPLPAVTLHDRLDTPERVRRTPNGGWAWKCDYCARYASARSVKGKNLCRCHGGSTPRQRDPLQSCLHQQQTGQPLRTPGRPLIHGRYARLPTINIPELLADYRQRRAKDAERFHRRCLAQIKRDQEWLTVAAGQMPCAPAICTDRTGGQT